MREITTGLQFPEGPIAMQDGSVILVEIRRGTLSKVETDGTVSVIAECGGGPNGAAIGPDGRIYICNNGGFTWKTINGQLRPIGTPDDYTGGSIQTVDPASGSLETLYTECDNRKLKGPNDLVFDQSGGFYFTDLGKRHDDTLQRGAIYYAQPDGSSITAVVRPIEQPNGIALSPDGKRLYAAETFSAKIRYWDIISPGKLADHTDPWGVGNILYGFQGHERLDSMAVDSDGNVCVATLGTGCISAVSPEGRLAAVIPVPKPDIMVTNICFGGTDMRTAYITSSGHGILYQADWHCAGHPLYFNG
ncbi:gluconolaconase [Chromatiales bacterium (ex Bugula neritina AB1)]|nr:gluconolaconase [Chromatiales bacterium (ex Bugula neritina AB1)]